MAKRCPSCRTEVADNARVCPNCPWMFPEDEEDNAPPASVATHWSPLPLAVLALVVGGLLAVWYFIATFTESSRPPQEQARPVPQTQAGRDQYAASKDTASAASEPDELSPKLREAVYGTTAKPKKGAAPARPVEEPVVVITREPPAKPAKPVKEWRLRGAVYDLMTLKPVAHAKVVLTNFSTNARFETATSGDGRYRAIVPPIPDDGYTVNIAGPGYASSYLDPGTEGVAQKPQAERQDLCRDLAGAVLQPATLQPHGGDPLVTDFYIAPVSCR